jgi:predicted alpha/beta superfamily hydrolase
MKKIFLFFLFAIILQNIGFGQNAKSTVGKVRHFEKFPSIYVQARHVDVWLPADYDSTQKYAVLYMHDGQMLYDSTSTWNHQEWQIDEAMTKLLQDKKIRNTIVVGIWNNGAFRHSEYFPQKAIKYIPKNIADSLNKINFQGKAQADNYLRFLTKELKPFIDKTFSTYTDKDNTFIAGSSMGGLISFYAICEYPKIFGAAACISTHWIGDVKQKNDFIPQAFQKYFAKNMPSPKKHRLYFDYGTVALDSLYKRHQIEMDKILQAKGYTENNCTSKEFVGEDHSEKSWAKRIQIPLVFLLRKD